MSYKGTLYIILLICLSAIPLVRLRTYKETAIDFLLDKSTLIILKAILFSVFFYFFDSWIITILFK